MLRSARELHGYKVRALDGSMGRVSEFYFDDRTWAVKHVVVDAGLVPPRRRVFVEPAAIGEPRWEDRVVPVRLTRDQIRSSPSVDTDKPVARQHFAAQNPHYSPDICCAETWIGTADPPIAVENETANPTGAPFDAHLRTTRFVAGHRIQAADGLVGHVVDFIVDDATWIIPHLVVALRSLVGGARVLIPTAWVTKVRWEERKVYVDRTVQEVRDAPPYDPVEMVTRRVQTVAYDYRGRPRIEST